MNNKNEQSIIKSFLNLDTNIERAQKYINETYNIESEYDRENDILYIWSTNINESLNLALAKNYICDNIGNEMINVMYGKKQMI